LTLLLVAILLLPPLRRNLLTRWIVKAIAALHLLPKISDTERAAIEAGNAWVEQEFFTGKPDFRRMLQAAYPQLSAEEQGFLDGPVEQACAMATDWEIYQRKDLPPELWKFLRHERFFGMMIPQEFGGRGFSNLAYSAVMVKLASRSFTHVATVGVTNSLGPAKLLLRYGTPEQKARYLPRLAIGEEIPCFALTEPTAGSDAASLTSHGDVFRGDDGQLYLRLNWQKRYITLGSIATLLGLAFRLRDPENLLDRGEDVGITCALVPTDTPGVVIDHRHDPMGVPFYNSPTEGHDVILPIDHIIGGIGQAGHGWTMLMQTLASGRGVSFPASCTGVGQLVARITGDYSVIRQQFGLSIGRFGGVEEPLARIGGFTYMLDAVRLYTVGAVDDGEQPAVVSAIAKYVTTELARRIVLDGMDILGGAGICRGPRNLLANIYTAMPIAITVEGANILTRSLMIFGQGAIRCHPYVYDEIQALQSRDVAAFDRLLWPHLGALVSNGLRSLVLTLTRGAFVKAPVAGETARYYRQLAWASSIFALLTDVTLLTYGGRLKRDEKLTGRFADLLVWQYVAIATLRRFEAEGQQPEDLPLVHWSLHHALSQLTPAFEGILENLHIPVLGQLLRWLGTPLLRLNPISQSPTDELGHEVAARLQTPGAARDRLTAGIYLPTDSEQSLGRLERAFDLLHTAQPVLQKIKQASRAGQLPQGRPETLLDLAAEQGVLSEAETTLVRAAELARNDAIQVDAFTFADYQRSSGVPEPSAMSQAGAVTAT
ncbi:acyl-CoA dehydrogenase, partial [Nodosilinea sp. LEGE 07088]|uniref:acyl-CoA dehydrogenase n=1 Tax=Nodosilinea sp. LEGE 07088 TaxID=2777968 RepID=UPI00188155B3